MTALSLPVSYVANEELRLFSIYTDVFGIKTFKDVLFTLTELVEKEVSHKMTEVARCYRS